MVAYVFRDKPVTIKAAAKADPQKIGDALAAITEQQNGHLTPKSVVEAARAPRHVLHRHFEWDDQLAAESFRLDQARNLIRSIRIVSDDQDEPLPAYVSISDKGGVSYRTLSDVLDSVELQVQALKQAERDLEAFEKRYRSFTEICDVVRQAREKTANRRSKLESRAHA